jgi:hypothetical protein
VSPPRQLIVERKGRGKWHVVTRTSSLLGGPAHTLCGRTLPYGCARAYLSEVDPVKTCVDCENRR